MILNRGRIFVFLVPLLLAAPFALAQFASDDAWEALHQEMANALVRVSEEYFGPAALSVQASGAASRDSDNLQLPWMVVVGFTGGRDAPDSGSSGVVTIRKHLDRQYGETPEIVLTKYNNRKWRDAAADVLERVKGYRTNGGRQPLVVAYAHSRGAGSIGKLAEELNKQQVELSLAIYIDAFSLRNPRLSGNIRYAANFYPRAGVFSGLPLRGKSRLIPLDESRTTVLGNYEIKPHYFRLKNYLQDILSANFELLRKAAKEPVDAAAHHSLFDRVVILGASISAEEKAPSPGALLARHAGTNDDNIFVFAEGGVKSERLLGFLDNIDLLKPSLIIGIDVFYHDFAFSLFLSDAKKDYLRSFIRRLHDTGAVVVIGNIPNMVFLRHSHVNSFLNELKSEFPNLVIVDIDTLSHQMSNGGIPIQVDGEQMILKRRDLMADRLHPNILGSKLLANVVLENLRERFPDLVGDLTPLEVRPVDSQ